MTKQIESQFVEEKWDVKKIIIGTVLLLLLAGGAYAAKQYFAPSSIIPQDITHIQTTIGVKGAATNANGSSDSPTVQSDNHATFSLPSSTDIQNQIQHIQQQVTSLNVSELASSSPQVQSIIQQIEQLPKVPANAAKEACINLCNRL